MKTKIDYIGIAQERDGNQNIWIPETNQNDAAFMKVTDGAKIAKQRDVDWNNLPPG